MKLNSLKRSLLAVSGVALLGLVQGCDARRGTGHSSGGASSSAQPVGASSAKAGGAWAGVPWLKGQTHLHSSNSGDSHTSPEDVVRWYASHGYDFLVFTDHNQVTQARPSPRPGMLVFAGTELTWNARTCGPPEAPCNLHMNALFTAPGGADQGVSLSPADPDSRTSIFEAELALVSSLRGIAQLNHPNYHYSADASVLVHLARQGLRLVEFSNASDGVQNEGDARHPGTETLWNQTLSAGVDLWNVASDDAHHYDDAPALRAKGEEVYVGERGWVMVRARRDGAAIRDAMMRGEFYATTGVILDDVVISHESISLSSRQPGLRATLLADPGRAVATADGPTATLSFAAIPPDARWVRAVVEDARGHKAWIQPLRVERAGAGLQVRGPFAPLPAASPPAMPSAAPAPGAEVWDTTSEAVNGRGAGKIQMALRRNGSHLTLAYGDSYEMQCLRQEARCEGTWRGKSGAGWFSIRFAPDDRSFQGSWGYDADRKNSASFSGTRR